MDLILSPASNFRISKNKVSHFLTSRTANANLFPKQQLANDTVHFSGKSKALNRKQLAARAKTLNRPTKSDEVYEVERQFNRLLDQGVDLPPGEQPSQDELEGAMIDILKKNPKFPIDSRINLNKADKHSRPEPLLHSALHQGFFDLAEQILTLNPDMTLTDANNWKPEEVLVLFTNQVSDYPEEVEACLAMGGKLRQADALYRKAYPEKYPDEESEDGTIGEKMSKKMAALIREKEEEAIRVAEFSKKNASAKNPSSSPSKTKNRTKSNTARIDLEEQQKTEVLNKVTQKEKEDRIRDERLVQRAQQSQKQLEADLELKVLEEALLGLDVNDGQQPSAWKSVTSSNNKRSRPPRHKNASTNRQATASRSTATTTSSPALGKSFTVVKTPSSFDPAPTENPWKNSKSATSKELITHTGSTDSSRHLTHPATIKDAPTSSAVSKRERPPSSHTKPSFPKPRPTRKIKELKNKLQRLQWEKEVVQWEKEKALWEKALALRTIGRNDELLYETNTEWMTKTKHLEGQLSDSKNQVHDWEQNSSEWQQHALGLESQALFLRRELDQKREEFNTLRRHFLEREQTYKNKLLEQNNSSIPSESGDPGEALLATQDYIQHIRQTSQNLQDLKDSNPDFADEIDHSFRENPSTNWMEQNLPLRSKSTR